MKILSFLEKRSILLVFVTGIYIILGSLLIFMVPSMIYNQSIDAIEDQLKEYADDYETVTLVSEGYNLYVHENGVSTLLTRSGYIVDMNAELDAHLIMWGELQQTPNKFYIDDFEGDNYVYYIKVLGENQYVITFMGTADVNGFISMFRSYSIGLIIFLYIISIILGSTLLSGQLIKKISFTNPKTNFHNKLSLISFFGKRKLEDFEFAYVNIHNFEDIVDSCGVTFTDMIVMTIGDRVRSVYKENEIYELNENEFIIVCKDSFNTDDVLKAFEKEMQGHSEMDTYQLRVKMVTINKRLLSSETILSLIKKFEYAYSTIKSKQDSCVNIDNLIVEKMNNQMYYQGNLEHALKLEKLVNFYQPKVDTLTDKIVGCEALSRWFEEDKYISPTNYINIAEANGLIYNIDLLSFKNSCRMIQRLKEEGLLTSGFKVSTNLSPITLKNLDFKVLEDIMNEYQVLTKNISVEVTESVVIEFDRVSKVLKDISESGITIEIDDFSAGNSSFTVLPILNADYLKLDMAILPTNFDDSNETLVYEGLVDISKRLGFKLISEGVETKEQVEYVKKIGVDLIQGYYYSKPISDEDFIKYLKK